MTYRDFLIIEYNSRKKINSNYSLRAYARDLNLSAGFLSNLVNGKKKPTFKSSHQILKKLNLNEDETSQFLYSIVNQESPSKIEDLKILKEEEFKVISEWYYYAILSLTKVKGAKTDPQWFAKRLGISNSEANEAILRLKRLNYITEQDGKYFQCNPGMTTSTDIPSPIIRNYHKKNLELAALKLSIVPVELRDFSSITFAADLSKLKKVKKIVTNFRNQISEILENENATEVYTLAIQLFPITNKEGRVK